MSLVLVRKTHEFAAVVCDERCRIENRNGGLIRTEDGYQKLIVLRPDMVVGVTGLLAPSQVLRHRLLKFFHANYTHPDLFDRLQDEISAELRTLFKSFSSVLSEVHLSDFIAIVLVGVDQQQKIRCICWNSESAPDFHAVEYFDDFVCLGNDLAVTHAQLLLSLRNPYLGPAESLLELE